MPRTVLIALALGLLASGCEGRDATVSEPMTEPAPTGSETVDIPQPEGEGDPDTGLTAADTTQTGAPTSSGDTATISQPTGGTEKQTNVESASELTEDKGETATVN